MSLWLINRSKKALSALNPELESDFNPPSIFKKLLGLKFDIKANIELFLTALGEVSI